MLPRDIARDTYILAELPARSARAYETDAIQACGTPASPFEGPPARRAIGVSRGRHARRGSRTSCNRI